MKITKENARSAIGRFYCSITLGFPPLEELYSIETEGKAAAELRGYDFQSIGQQIDNGPGTCPVTRAPLNILTLSPAKQLFSLVLAIVETTGHLDSLKKENEQEFQGFNAFANTPDYELALEAGRKLLANLVKAPGNSITEKIQSLRLSGVLNTDELVGGEGQIKLLAHTLGLGTDFNDFANHYKKWSDERASLQKACIDGDSKAVAEILQQHPEWLNAVIGTKRTRYTDAHPAFRKELKKGTPLMLAAAHGHLDLVDFLLQQKADVSVTCDGETALTHAFDVCHYFGTPRYDIAKALTIKGANVNQETGKTNLLLRSWFLKETTVAMKLVEFGADVVSSEQLFNSHHKEQCKHQPHVWHVPEEIVKLKEHIKSQRRRALTSACRNGEIKTVCEMLENVDPTEKKSLLEIEGLLETAAHNGHMDLVNFLLEQPEIRNNVSRVSSDGTTTLHRALHPLENFKNANYEIAAILIQAGADINQVTPEHGNLLLTAWTLGNQTAAQQLISLGADVARSEAFVTAKAMLEYNNNAITREQRKSAAITLLGLFDIKGVSERDTYVRARSLMDKNLEYRYEQQNEKTWHPDGIPAQIELSKQFLKQACNQPFPGAGSLLLSWEQWRERYNQRFPGPEQHGYGPGAMVVYKP